ncbi:hypothetical protein E4U09_007692 [Claviceps aff. purpurea]|uniref:Uncharacterized protein n=1 Tax=Claviceps aff. purpurea TaxID=1967640 RepID=A0A9P7QEA8_9HYPO|nr:hypothetical protein E4U09_007692 [Claviceps aff. purpurea]
MPEITSLRFEVLAGQHRIAALREYVSDTESDPAELWWTCELYDQDTTIDIGSSDWDQLAVGFATRGDLTPDALAKFYNVFGRKRRRRHGLLTSLSDSEYDAFYRHMTTADQHDFSSPHQIPRSHLEAMVQVLHHIIAWIDPEMMVTLLQQSRGGHPKRQASDPHVSQICGTRCATWRGATACRTSRPATNKLSTCRRPFLIFAREHVAEFLSCPARLTFFKGASALNLTTSDYTTRFVYGVWTHLLRFTREYIATIIKSPTLIFYEEWDRVAVTSPTPVELSDLLSSVIANARDAAAKAKITRAGQEALEIIQKPGNSQGGRASGTAESHSSINSTDLPRAPAAMSRPKIENGR